MCNKCDRELISKAGLKKHRERCQGVDGQDVQALIVDSQLDECRNGPSCWFLKHNKCSFQHDEPKEMPWKKVQPMRHSRQHGYQQKQEQQQHVQPKQQGQKQQHQPQQQPRKQQPKQRHTRSESIICKNGPRCRFLRDDKCLFLHEKQQHQQPRQDSRQPSSSGAQNKNVSTNQLKPCKFGPRCDKGMRCEYLHLPKDFLPVKGGRKN